MKTFIICFTSNDMFKVPVRARTKEEARELFELDKVDFTKQWEISHTTMLEIVDIAKEGDDV